jgi:hypothetical protein
MLLHAETFRVDLPADSKINGLDVCFDFVSPEGAGAFRPTLGSSAAGACITGNPQSSVNNPG